VNLDDTEVHEFVCEVDGHTEHLTDRQAFDAGWDYPPFMGTWGIVSPRTCPNHGIEHTAWWALQTGQELTEAQTEFCIRVSQEVAPV
jgi:hypothetical protein